MSDEMTVSDLSKALESLEDSPGSFDDDELEASDTENPESPSEDESSGDEDAGEDIAEAETEIQEAPDDADEITLVIKGQAQRMTREEAAQGYLRQADYTRKTQKLAEQDREIASTLERLKEALAQNEADHNEKAPNWEKFFDEDPVAAAREFALHRTRQDKIANEKHLLDVANKEFLERQKAEQMAALEAGYEKLLQSPRFSNWRDPAARTKHIKKLQSYAETRGFSSGDVSRIQDPRFFEILDDALRFHEAQNSGKKAVQKQGEKPVGGLPARGARQKVGTSSVQSKAVKAAQDKFKKSGDVGDLAALLSQQIAS